MKRFSLKLLVVAAACWAGPLLAGEMSAAIRNCGWCHGTSGQGYANAPRLAGQRPAYLERQLISFHNHSRDNPASKQYMWGAVEGLDPLLARNLAIYFSTVAPKAAHDGQLQLADIGRGIFEEGLPELNIASCAACHGPNAEGIRDIPRLGGLSYNYLRRRLGQWGEGYHATAQFPMPEISKKLAPQEIEALASYLSFIEYID
jgi:cytochrome c553